MAERWLPVVMACGLLALPVFAGGERKGRIEASYGVELFGRRGEVI